MIAKKTIITITLLIISLQNAYAETVLHGLHGEKTPFSSLAGKWVFINYWASWCGPCVDEIPQLNRFYEQNKDKNFAMFAVNYDALPVAQQELLIDQLNIHYPALKQDPAKPLNLGDINGVPVTFVFNPQGILVDTLYGGQTVRSLNKVLAAN